MQYVSESLALELIIVNQINESWEEQQRSWIDCKMMSRRRLRLCSAIVGVSLHLYRNYSGEKVEQQGRWKELQQHLTSELRTEMRLNLTL